MSGVRRPHGRCLPAVSAIVSGMLLRVARSLAIGWILATSVVPAIVSVADARSEALASQVTRHVEQPGGSKGCAVAHAADCVACTLLRAVQLPAAPAPGPMTAAAQLLVWSGPGARLPVPPTLRLALPRAPPAA